MYTRCPSCRAEISFEPPANADSLPDGYKHKIKCPSCGVTIGVKIPKITSDIQPTYTPQNPTAVHSEPVFQASTDPVTAKEAKKELKKSNKKAYGRGANIVMLILSLILVACSVIGNFINAGKIDVEILNSLAVFDGITPITNIIEAGGFGDATAVNIILALLPSITLVLAAINFLVSLIACIGGKYSKAYNLIFGLLICAGAVCTLLQGFFGTEIAFVDYFKAIIEAKSYLAFVPAGIGVLIFLFSLFFLAVRKPKNQD